MWRGNAMQTLRKRKLVGLFEYRKRQVRFIMKRIPFTRRIEGFQICVRYTKEEKKQEVHWETDKSTINGRLKTYPSTVTSISRKIFGKIWTWLINLTSGLFQNSAYNSSTLSVSKRTEYLPEQFTLRNSKILKSYSLWTHIS